MALRSRGNPDRHLVVFSDIEMGAGGAVDDFPHSGWLAERIRRRVDENDDLHLDLVFNGDTFDLLKTSYRDAWPAQVTSDIAVGKMARIVDAHAPFFSALREALAYRKDRIGIHFVAGNHDLELFFPEVQELLRNVLAADDRVRFHGHSFEIGRLHVEHGSQLDPLFRVDPRLPFLEHEGQRILNLSWTSVALLDLVIPLQGRLGHHDRLKPKKMLLELMPDLREYLSALAWGYWTRDWWRDFFGTRNPVKRLSWTMLKEVVWRTVSFDVEIAPETDVEKRLVESDRYDVYLLGHVHEPAWRSYGDRKLLRTGCLRDEFMLSDHGRTQTAINKTWAELFMCGDHVVRSHLVEEVAPPRPPGMAPDSIFDVLPWVRAQLGSAEARDDSRAAQAAEESRERDGGDER